MMATDQRNRGAAAIVAVVLIAALVVAGFVAWRMSSRQAPPRNVLLIVADALRADHLGCYGRDDARSPRLDRLASEGVLFTDFSTVIPATLPSFSSLLTSRHPKDHGAVRNGFALDGSHPTMSEVFQAAGFETAAFVASYCISKEFGLARGFDRYDEDFTTDTGLPHNKLVRRGEKISDAVIDWLGGRDRSKPFFAMVHYFDPHWPYDQPDPFRETFTPRGNIPGLGSIQNVLDARDFLKGGGGVPDQRCHDLHALYLGEIAFMDREIGRVLDTLGELGIEGETLVVFTSDHGETFWEHADYFDHGLFVYDSNARIPLIVRWPGRTGEASRRVRPPLSNIDLAPTLLDLAGLVVPAAFDGRSFAGLITGENEIEPRPIYSEACKPYQVEKGAPRANYYKAKSVRSGKWKLVYTPFLNDSRELYNVETDPTETTNLLRNPAYKKIADSLFVALERWTDTFEGGGPVDPLDPETEEKLRKLGY